MLGNQLVISHKLYLIPCWLEPRKGSGRRFQLDVPYEPCHVIQRHQYAILLEQHSVIRLVSVTVAILLFFARKLVKTVR